MDMPEKEAKAIKILKNFQPQDEPYYLCYSGGKDSDVIRILADLEGVKHEIHHNLTTVDAPETVRYVKSIPNVIIDKPRYTMWQLIPQKGIPPTRLVRYCCAELKESGGKGRLKITGVRWDESRNRKENGGVVKIIGKTKTIQKEAEEQNVNYLSTKKGGVVLNIDNDDSRRFVEQCYRTTSTMVNPIIDWTEQDVWDFLHHYGCESNPLYRYGAKRIGCIGCPMGSVKQRKEQFGKYPKYKMNYIRAFERMVQARNEKGFGKRSGWTNGADVFRWWMEEDINQIGMFDDEYDALLEEIKRGV